MKKRMNSMFFATLCAGLLVSAASCKKDGGENATPATGAAFTATTESHKSDSKTHLDGVNVMWDWGDNIVVYNNSNEKYTFGVVGVENNTAAFDGGEDVPRDFFDKTPFTAIYPSNMGNTAVNKLVIPGNQIWQNGTFGRDYNPMTAKSSTTQLSFKNVCGLLKLQLTGIGTVKQITVTSKKTDEKLNGTFDLTVADNGVPTLTPPTTGGSNTVTLTNINITLTNTSTPLYVVVPEGTLNDGFTVDVTFYDNSTTSFSAGMYTGTGNRIVRSQIREMPSKCAVTDVLPGTFSVSPTKKVHFSKGNLWCDASDTNNPTWHFEENQYSSATLWNLSHVSHLAWNKDPKKSYLATPEKTANEGDILFTNDPNNATSPNPNFLMDGATTNKWRVLVGGTYSTDGNGEWQYLIEKRAEAESKNKVVDHSFAKVKVNGLKGLMLFPDNFNFSSWPEGITIIETTNYDNKNINFTAADYTATQFEVLQSMGVVFLPAAGYRNGSSNIIHISDYGGYWGSKCSHDAEGNRWLGELPIFDDPRVVTMNSNNVNFAFLVRLVQDI